MKKSTVEYLIKQLEQAKSKLPQEILSVEGPITDNEIINNANVDEKEDVEKLLQEVINSAKLQRRPDGAIVGNTQRAIDYLSEKYLNSNEDE